jgi:beta-glucosidase
MSDPSTDDSPSSLDLPAGFLWGTSTSSYQIEGAAQLDGRGPSIWDTFCRQPGKVMNGDHGDVACDHYHRYRDDIALMQSLGMQAYRFSVSWPRVLPAGRGAINEKGLSFYDRLIDELLQNGIEPWLCLYHWDLPQALEDKGGWANRDCAGWYADYAALIGRRYGDRVKQFATFNEQTISCLFGYLLGTNAPGKTSVTDYLHAMHHLNLAHGLGTQALRSTVQQARIGAVYTLQPVKPASDSVADQVAALALDSHWNGAFADPQQCGYYPKAIAEGMGAIQQAGDLATICQHQDWIGINHYSPLYARASNDHSLGFALADAPADAEKSAIGWPIDADAFTTTLIELSRKYKRPIYVTENGYGGYDTPDEDGHIRDVERVHYLDRYTRAMATAVRKGADIRGYFVWSLLDNFEWAFGYSNRFGIVHVDFATQQRTPKASAHWYRQLIEKNHG